MAALVLRCRSRHQIAVTKWAGHWKLLHLRAAARMHPRCHLRSPMSHFVMRVRFHSNRTASTCKCQYSLRKSHCLAPMLLVASAVKQVVCQFRVATCVPSKHRNSRANSVTANSVPIERQQFECQFRHSKSRANGMLVPSVTCSGVPRQSGPAARPDQSSRRSVQRIRSGRPLCPPAPSLGSSRARRL